jgi:hypothetical protein
MTTADQARAAVENLIAQLDHADRLITEQSQRIDTLECENRHLRDALILARRVIDPDQFDVLEEIDMTLYGDHAAADTAAGYRRKAS